MNVKEIMNSIEAQFSQLDRLKKLHFHPNRGLIKFSTVHSFKGWESSHVILFIPDKRKNPSPQLTEIIYTGLTRAKKNLFIVNCGDGSFEHHDDVCANSLGEIEDLIREINGNLPNDIPF